MTLGHRSDVAGTGSNITAQVTVGNYTSVGPHVQMHSLTEHSCIQDRGLVTTYQLHGYPPPLSEEKMTIGSDVWIGRNAVLLGNLTIGDGAIIGAFSVVAKDVPPYAVVVGNPATIKRYRFTEYQIEKLLKIQWWSWTDEKVKECEEDFLNIDTFINKHF